MKFDPEAWTLSRPQLGDLNTVFILPAKEVPQYLLVLCHGFGAPGTDLVNLFDDILHYLPDNSPPFAYLCPEGPIDLEEAGIPGGRAWWPLNMAQLMRMAETNSFDSMRTTVPPEIDSARNQVEATIRLALEQIQTKYPEQGKLPIVVGGFSQGAMLATDITLRGTLEDQAGLIAYSGALICEKEWRATTRSVKGMPFVQSHGRLDNILPFETGRWLHQLLIDLELDGKLLEFDGPHTISGDGILQAAKLLHVVSSKR